MKRLRTLITMRAATPAGVVSVLFRDRGCRSFLAQPPANRWHPSGMTRGENGRPDEMTVLEPGDVATLCGMTVPEPGDVATLCGKTIPEPGDVATLCGMTVPEPGDVATLCEMTAPEPGGFKAISRWLRSAATTPPVHGRNKSRIPEGCQP